MEKINLDSIRQLDLINLALSTGFYRDKTDKKVYRRDSLKVHIDDKTLRFNSFTDPNVHGIGAIDFIMKTENMNFKSAVEYLSKQTANAKPLTFFPTGKEKTAKFKNDERKLIMPSKDADNKKAFNYLLLERKIDKDILGRLFNLGKIYQDIKGNAVFVCSDISGKHTGSELKSKNFKGMCLGSNRLAGSFYIKSKSPIKNIVITESAIDCLSYAVIKKSSNTIYISTAGVISYPTEFIKSCLKKYPIEKIIIGYDCDIPGQNFARNLKLSLEKEFNGVIEIEKPAKKDWNDDLQYKKGVRFIYSFTPDCV
jgi:hypothetical protein